MRCEVCGRKIYGKPYRVIIEGAKLTVCGKCAKLGTGRWEEKKPKTFPTKPRKPARPVSLKTSRKKPQQITVDNTLELTGHFSEKIRQARERLELSHEKLGKKIAEKASVLKKIETGKMIPDNRLTAKLEHALKIKLLAPAKEEKAPRMEILKLASRELTLGDLIRLDEKKTEEKKQRKQS